MARNPTARSRAAPTGPSLLLSIIHLPMRAGPAYPSPYARPPLGPSASPSRWHTWFDSPARHDVTTNKARTRTHDLHADSDAPVRMHRRSSSCFDGHTNFHRSIPSLFIRRAPGVLGIHRRAMPYSVEAD
ncbi:hypothetical protein C8J57DRAFT_1508238 [Mycena rebaudengoi]|nr:hypothetical protein C8J57DRAFT_1508238 [Mycena rebaudengoi]